MSLNDAVVIFSEAILTTFKLSLPILLISMVVGLIVSVFQAATQIHEQILTFVPKVIVLGVSLIVLGPWLIRVLVDFFNRVIKFTQELIK